MMQYEIVGTPFPAVVCRLAQNESMHCESNGMAWMSPNMEMDTNTGGGIGKLFGRAFSGESLFRCTYTARQGEGMISFASSMPGRVLPLKFLPSAPLWRRSPPFWPRKRASI